MNINKLQEKIDNTMYWDMEVLDISIDYFGDEVNIVIADEKETCWTIKFLSCCKVAYETDANRRRIRNVKEMKKSQLGYYAQDITIDNVRQDDVLEINLDLSIMDLKIECKEILVERHLVDEFNFFWNDNIN